MISSFCLLVACAPMSRYEAVKSPAILKAVQNARTCSDHGALAKRFENLAKEMRMKAENKEDYSSIIRKKATSTGDKRRIGNRIPGL